MKAEDETERTMAWEIVQLLDKLSHVLWIRYGGNFIDLYLEEEEEPFAPGLPEEP